MTIVCSLTLNGRSVVVACNLIGDYEHLFALWHLQFPRDGDGYTAKKAFGARGFQILFAWSAWLGPPPYDPSDVLEGEPCLTLAGITAP